MRLRVYCGSILLILFLPSECVLPSQDPPEPPDAAPPHRPGSPPRIPARYMLGNQQGDGGPFNGNRQNAPGGPVVPAQPVPRPNRQQGPLRQPAPRPMLPAPQALGQPQQAQRPSSPPSPLPPYPQGPFDPNPPGSPPHFPQRFLLGGHPGDVPPGLTGHSPVFARVPGPPPPQGQRPQAPQGPVPQQARGPAPPAAQAPMPQLPGNPAPPHQDRRQQRSRGSRLQHRHDPRRNSSNGPRANLPQGPSSNSQQRLMIPAAHIRQPIPPARSATPAPHGRWPPGQGPLHACPVMCLPGQIAGQQCGSHPNCKCTIDLLGRSLAHLPCQFIPSG